MNRKRKSPALWLLVGLLAAVTVFFTVWQGDADRPPTFLAGTEEIRLWTREDGESFVFLPSFASMDQLRLSSETPLTLDDRVLTDDCGALEPGTRYPLTMVGEEQGSLTFLQSANIPALYLDTASGSMETIHAEKGNFEPGQMRLYTAEGSLDYEGRLESVKARGNSTFTRKKKPYSLTLAAEGDLLGMGAASEWILLANVFDETHLKNKLVFDFAEALGMPYTPKAQWVDLYLNGEYAGLYLLSERNEAHPQRVDILEEGSFLVSKEQLAVLNEKQVPTVVTEAQVGLRIHHSSLTKNALQEILQSAENAILAQDGIDPVTGKHFTELIDLDSWVRKYLIEEIFGGIDAGIASQFFYYQDNKLYAGPLWDFDDTMGMPVWVGFAEVPQSPNILYAHRKYETHWFRALYQNEVFHTRMLELYREEFAPKLHDLIRVKLPEYAAHIQSAAAMNQVRWDTDSMESKAESTLYYMAGRVEFLNKIWLDEEPYITISVDYTGFESDCAYLEFDYVLSPGDCLPELPTTEDFAWFYAGTEIPFDFTQPIWEDTAIRLQYAYPVEEAPEEGRSLTSLAADILRVGPPILLVIFLFALVAADILRTKRSD